MKPDMSKCDSCETMVGSETLIEFTEWSYCEDCWDKV